MVEYPPHLSWVEGRNYFQFSWISLNSAIRSGHWAEDNSSGFQEIETQRPGLSADLSEPRATGEKGARSKWAQRGGMRPSSETGAHRGRTQARRTLIGKLRQF